MRILGIDPGTNLLGYGAVEVHGNKFTLLNLGTVQIDRQLETLDKLQMIYNRVNQLITVLDPDEMAIESPFFGKNVQSMLKLGRAQGVAIAAALNAGIKVTEYSPKKIKKSVTGNGNASKHQVAAMLKNFVNCSMDAYGEDATDALATAICHSLQNNPTTGQKKYKDWKSYVNQNTIRKI